MALDTISVVIRTFDSGATLPRVLAALEQIPGDQIIIVDSGSKDATLEIAKKNGAMVIPATGPFNYSKSLNLGFKEALNDWVLVLSSHAIPLSTDFLAAYRKELAALPENVVVGYGPSSISGKTDPDLESQHASIFGAQDFDRVGRVCGNGNSIYRRSAWVELPFDESIRTSEDKIWIMEMIRRNYLFAYLPTVATVNRNQASLAYMFRKGYSDARTLRGPEHKPMTPRQLAGALKNIGKQRLGGEIDNGNWLRYSAHTFGQFFASYQAEDNIP